ncbi:MAG: hypothetical protein ACYTG6_08005 [Planctomycetota bacterium]|jgi:hypothetical protein
MNGRTWSIGTGLALAAVAVFLGFGTGTARTARAGNQDETLRYAASYAAAWEEAKERNTLIFATFHKDK